MLDAPNPYHCLTTDGGEHGSPTGPSEDSQPKTIPTRVPNGFFRYRCDQDPSAVKPMFEFDPYDKSCDKLFSPPEENEEQITKKNSKLKMEGLITYSTDQQIFKFKVTTGHKYPTKTSNPDELTNLELWG